MTQDAMGIDEEDEQTQLIETRVEVVQEEVTKEAMDPSQHDDEVLTRRSDERRTTEGSFHSAKEDMASGEQTAKPELNVPQLPQEQAANVVEADEHKGTSADGKAIEEADEDVMLLDPKETQNEDDRDSLLDDDAALAAHTPSDGYSPAKPVVRKSSLTFASLPAREPLTTKRSMGARASRTSQLDQARANGLSRGSYLGRFTGGKSLGNKILPDQDISAAGNDPMDVDGALHYQRKQDELDGDALTTQLHNKASTQRLHDRINMLGKSNENKVTKTATFAQKLVQPSYPELSKDLSDRPSEAQNLPKPQLSAMGQIDDDGDEWIKPLAKKSEILPRPHLSKSRSVDVMEKIDGKDSIGGKDLGIGPQEIQAVRQGSPLRSNSVTERTVSAERLNSALPDLPAASQEESMVGKHMDQQYAHLKAFALPEPSTTPAGSPARLHHDGPLSASKSKLQSIMKSARGLFTSSAGASAQAKMELTPSSRTRSKDSLRPDSPNKAPGPSALSNGLYPDLNMDTQSTTSDGRKTRSSTDREEKARSKELKARQQMELDLQRARDQERIKAAIAKEQQLQRQASAETVPKASAPMQEPKVTRQSPRRAAKHEINETLPHTTMPSSTPATEDDDRGTAEQMPPPPPRTQIAQVQISKAKDVRRPIKPAKDAAPKPKPLPVAIKVGTSSQRIALSNTALSSSLQDSLPAPPPQPAPRPATLTKKGSTASLQSTISNPSMKSSASSAAPKPRALLAAKRQKEQVCRMDLIMRDCTNRPRQDEKEAARKLEHKREIERKRAVQQEEALRKEQQRRQEVERQERERSAAMDDPKKAAQKQAIEKRRMELLKKDQTRNVSKPMNDLVSLVFPLTRTSLILLRHMPCIKTKCSIQYLSSDQSSTRQELHLAK